MEVGVGVGVGITYGGGLGERVAVGGNSRRKNGTRVGLGVAVSVTWPVEIGVCPFGGGIM